ncbi:hypothetical protein ABW19_dt0200528 [Dactylella cylindrospora]|nr:hypothetical protein ABW19_dt0200528 [Dactylella cylindrospora]
MARRSKKRSQRGDRKKSTTYDKEPSSPLPTLPSFGDIPTFKLSSSSQGRTRKRSIDEISDGESSNPNTDRDTSKRHRSDDSKSSNGKADTANDEGWQTVTYKGGKNPKKDNSYPEFVISQQRVQGWTRIADLQHLIFHLLSHDAPPQWMLVRNKSSFRRVVYLHVPGLAMDLFDGRAKLITDSKDAANPAENTSSTLGEYFPIPLRDRTLPSSLSGLSDAFTHVLPVRAGGDNHKVFSPVHNMLNIPVEMLDDKAGNKKNRKQSKERLKIKSLLLSLEDMIENEYPVHEAYFTANGDIPVEVPKDRPEDWVETDLEGAPERVVESGSILEGYTIYALDCEMVKTKEGPSLARVSIVGWDGKVVLDELVKPEEEVEDYLTPFSGITEEILKDVKTTRSDIQEKLKSLINANTILVGQSLNSDLNALHYSHPYIVDTSVIYDHPRGKPMKPGLRWLAQKYLKEEIQKGATATGGHDSIEDARACLNLLKLKLEKGKDFGSNSSNFESIFVKLSQVQPHARTGAVVDYGDPAKRYGGYTQHTKKVTNDDEVVDGVLEAVNGDTMKGIAPVDFVWAHMNTLNNVRGWNNSYQKFINQLNGMIITASSPPIEIPAPPPPPQDEDLEKAVRETIGRILKIYEGLPKCSALVVYSGTGDPVEMGRLNAMQAVYRKEFKTRKWDECTVKWTDDEEQALRKAVGEARKGVALLGVK